MGTALLPPVHSSRLRFCLLIEEVRIMACTGLVYFNRFRMTAIPGL